MSGKEGEFGLAVGVDYAGGSSNAYLDGKATAGANVNVTAKETTNNLTYDKLFLFPTFVSGVSASAGTGSTSTGDLLDDTQTPAALKSAINKIENSRFANRVTAWMKQKLDANQNNNTPTNPTWQFGGALVVSVNAFDTTARIGDGGTDTATVAGSGGVNVTSSITSGPSLGAGATADSTAQRGSRTTTTTSASGMPTTTTTQTPVSGHGFALAVNVGVFTNDATAYIAGNAVVDSGGPLVVMSNPNNVFNPAQFAATNLAYAFEQSQFNPTYASGSGQQSMTDGNTVLVDSNYMGGGAVGQTYEYIGPQGASIDLGMADYADTTQWKQVSNGSSSPTYQSGSGPQSMTYGTTVMLASNYKGGGDGGATYEYIGPDNTSIDLGTADYSDTDNWKPYDVGGEAGLTFIETLFNLSQQRPHRKQYRDLEHAGCGNRAKGPVDRGIDCSDGL